MPQEYNNPPVKEIICQFRFSLDGENQWSSKMPGQLLSALGGDYPNLSTPANVGIGIQVQQGNMTPQI